MCDPLTLASVALMVGGTAANSVGVSRAAHARDDALAAERTRQTGLDQQADALNSRSQSLFENITGQQADKAQTLGDYFTQRMQPQAAAAGAPAETGLPTSSSNLVVQEEAKQRGQAQAFTDQTGQALGRLRSFGDVLAGAARGQARDAGQIGQLGGFKRGSSAVLPFELDAASAKGSGWRTTGDVLKGLGQVGLSAGLGGGSLFGAGSGAAVGGANPGLGAGVGRLFSEGGSVPRLATPFA